MGPRESNSLNSDSIPSRDVRGGREKTNEKKKKEEEWVESWGGGGTKGIKPLFLKLMGGREQGQILQFFDIRGLNLNNRV